MQLSTDREDNRMDGSARRGHSLGLLYELTLGKRMIIDAGMLGEIGKRSSFKIARASAAVEKVCGLPLRDTETRGLGRLSLK